MKSINQPGANYSLLIFATSPIICSFERPDISVLLSFWISTDFHFLERHGQPYEIFFQLVAWIFILEPGYKTLMDGHPTPPLLGKTVKPQMWDGIDDGPSPTNRETSWGVHRLDLSTYWLDLAGMSHWKRLWSFFHIAEVPQSLGEPSLRFLGFQYQLPKKQHICTAIYIYIWFLHSKNTSISAEFTPPFVTSQGRLPLGHHIFKDQEVFPPVLKLLTIRLVHKIYST